MRSVLMVVQVVLGVSLTVLILLQAKGVGFGRSVGGGSFHSRRGLEQLTFKVTIGLSVLFVSASLISHFI